MKTYSLLVGKSLANLFDAVFKIHDIYSFLFPNVPILRLSKDLGLFEFRVCSFTLHLQVSHKLT